MELFAVAISLLVGSDATVSHELPQSSAVIVRERTVQVRYLPLYAAEVLGAVDVYWTLDGVPNGIARDN